MLLEDHPLVIFMYSILHAFAKQTNNKSITNNTPCKLIFFSMIYYFSCVTRSDWFATQHWFAYHAGCVLWMIFDQNDHRMFISSVLGTCSLLSSNSNIFITIIWVVVPITIIVIKFTVATSSNFLPYPSSLLQVTTSRDHTEGNFTLILGLAGNWQNPGSSRPLKSQKEQTEECFIFYFGKLMETLQATVFTFFSFSGYFTVKKRYNR